LTAPTTRRPCTKLVDQHGFTPHIRSRGEEIADKLRTPGWRARRWVVEAAHSWLNRNRGILIRWSKRTATISPWSNSSAG
jgi:putative transposase